MAIQKNTDNYFALLNNSFIRNDTTFNTINITALNKKGGVKKSINYYNQSYSVAPIWMTLLSDGGAAISGLYYGFGSVSFPFIFKIDSVENLEWALKVEDSSASNVYIDKILSAGNYIFVVTQDFFKTGYQPVVHKIDLNGKLVWSKILRTSRNTGFADMILTTGNNLSASGFYVDSLFHEGTFFAKIDTNGNLLFTKYLLFNYDLYSWSLQETKDGFFLGSEIIEKNDNFYPSVSLFDKNGNYQWTKIYDGFYGIQSFKSAKSKQGLVLQLFGQYSFSNNHLSCGLLKIKPNGDPAWCRFYDLNNNHESYSVTPTIDSGFIMSADISGTAFLVKTDGIGLTGCNDTSINMGRTKKIPYAIGSDGQMFNISSTLTDFPLLSSTVSIKADVLCSSNMEKNDFAINPNRGSAEIQVYPNPSSNSISISGLKSNEEYDLILTKENSQIVFQKKIKTENSTVQFQLESLSAGIYFLTANSGSDSFHQKIVIVR
jgi:hypothetical protein